MKNPNKMGKSLKKLFSFCIVFLLLVNLKTDSKSNVFINYKLLIYFGEIYSKILLKGIQKKRGLYKDASL